MFVTGDFEMFVTGDKVICRKFAGITGWLERGKIYEIDRTGSSGVRQYLLINGDWYLASRFSPPTSMELLGSVEYDEAMAAQEVFDLVNG